MNHAPSLAADCQVVERQRWSTKSRFLVGHVWMPLLLFGVVLTVMHLLSVDRMIAHQLYEWQGGAWTLREHRVTEHVLHRGGRALFISLWLGVVVAWAVAGRRADLRAYREPLKRLCLATLISVGLVAWVKSWSGVDCPWDLREFGGAEPVIGFFKSSGIGTSGCFPAAHAGTGYAWLALYFFFRTVRPSWRWYGLAFGIALGALFGIGQQLRGAHFASHDMWSAAMCWAVALLVAWPRWWSNHSLAASDLSASLTASNRGIKSTHFPIGRWIYTRLRKRPVMSQEMLALIAAVYFTLLCNRPFFAAVAEANAFSSPGGIGLALSLIVAISAINTLLISLLFTRWTAKPALTLLLLVTALASFYMLNYGVYLDMQMVRNTLHTDSKESFELISTSMLSSVAVFGILPSIFVWRVQLVRRRWLRAVLIRTATLLLALLVAAAAVGFSFQTLSALMRNYPAMRHLVTPANYLVSLTRVVWGEHTEKGLARIPVGQDAQVVGKQSGSKPRLLVLVVGETVRAQNWGLNGYARQTTPKLATLPVVNFRDVTACGTSTEVSLPCMLSPFGRANYDERLIRRSESLLHVLEHAGIHTEWLDNQTGCKGTCEGLAFESYENGGSGDGCDKHGCLDEAMIAGLVTRAEKQTGDQVIVLHQLGNHGPAYFARYPTEFRRFTPACETSELGRCDSTSIVNAYDNAILYTDDFLARLIELLGRQTDRDAALIYLSDHGESLGENGLFLHGVPYSIAPETQTKVPMLVWLGESTMQSRGIDQQCLLGKAQQAVSHDNLFHSVLGLLQVNTSVYRPDLDFFGQCAAVATSPATSR